MTTQLKFPMNQQRKQLQKCKISDLHHENTIFVKLQQFNV